MNITSDALPSLPGTYALILHVDKPQSILVGRLGELVAPSGWVVYVGSAFGPGGLHARVGRHLGRPVGVRSEVTGVSSLAKAKRLHWHIDYLLQAVGIHTVWYTSDPIPYEHTWANVLGRTPGVSILMPGFGSSDCQCPSHLFYFASAPQPLKVPDLVINKM
jgi:Uri superfamily endonuclease